MKKYHLVIATGLLAVLIYPSVTFASWWNPFSWFKKKAVEQPIVQTVTVEPVETKKESESPKKTTTAPASVKKSQSAPVVKSCRPENAIIEKVPTLTGDTRGYFSRVIASNPPLNNLEGIRIALIRYREGAIASSANSTPPQVLVDENGERIPFSAEQLNAIDSSYSRISDLQIRGYYDWIRFMDQLITDKKADGCIDGRDLYDYM